MGLLERFRPLKADISTSDEIGAELGRLDKVKADAERELSRLGDMRPGLLVTASNDELATHDAAMARCRRDIEQADARRAVLEPEWRARETLDAEQRETAERAELYDAAVKARAEGKRLLGEYEKGAKALAVTLERLAAASQAIGRANDRLPAGKAEVEHFELNNGRTATPDQSAPMIQKWFTADGHDLGTSKPMGVPGLVSRMVKGYGGATIPGTGRSAEPHVPLFSRVALPRTSDPADGDHWRGGETRSKPLTADQTAVLRYHGLIQ